MLEIEFENYIEQIITPIELEIVNEDNSSIYNVTQEISDHNIGQREGGGLHANWNIQDGKLLVVGQGSISTNVITEIFNFSMKSLTTSERVYTKFKFI